MKKPIIFFADDDEDDRELFERAVQEADSSATCHLAKNGRELLIMLSGHQTVKPDIIFLDVSMPVMDGWECLESVKKIEEHRNIPVIIYSTTSQPHHVKKALLSGALCLITKPENFQTIKGIISEVIVNIENDVLEGIKKFPEVKWKI